MWSGQSFTFDINLTGGTARQVGLFVKDFDSSNRKQRIELLDPATGQVLDSKNMTNSRQRWVPGLQRDRARADPGDVAGE